MLICNSWKQYIVALKLVFEAGVITSRKYEKCHLFDANIRHVGRSRQKKSLIHNFSRNQYSSRRETTEKKILSFGTISKKVVNFEEINLWSKVSLRSNSPYHQRIRKVSCTPSQYPSFSTSGWK